MIVSSLIDISIRNQISREKDHPLLPAMGYQIWIREMRTTCLNFGRRFGHSTGAIDYLRLNDEAVILAPSYSMQHFLVKAASDPDIAKRIYSFEQFHRRYAEYSPHVKPPVVNTIIVDEAGFLKFRKDYERQEMINRFYKLCERLGVMHVVLLGSQWG